ncbi:vacuolar protein sorting-associated protein 45, partial [Linderina macrospora]
ALRAMIGDPKIVAINKVRCVILYALRYERMQGNATEELKRLLAGNGVDADMGGLVDVVVRYAGARERQSDIFQNEDLVARGKNMFKGLQGVENVYTQHSPALADMLEQLVRGKQTQQWQEKLGSVDGARAGVLSGEGGMRNQDVVVFMVGGVTLEEEAAVARLNAKFGGQGVRILLGGTAVHSSASFLGELSTTFFP